jgi:hypothetical protein
LRRRSSDDLDGGFGFQMFEHLAKNEPIHDDRGGGGDG